MAVSCTVVMGCIESLFAVVRLVRPVSVVFVRALAGAELCYW